MIQNIRERECSREKLRILEEEYQVASREAGDEEARDSELESLKGLINQIREEIARYEAHMVKPMQAE